LQFAPVYIGLLRGKKLEDPTIFRHYEENIG